MTNARPTIAIIIPGGIGTGKNNLGVPVLEQIINMLAKDFQVTVFQLYPRNTNFTVKNFELIDVYSTNPIFKILKFLFSFRNEQRKKKFKVIHGFWVLPGGFLAVCMGKLFKIKSIVSVLGGDAIALPEIQYGQLRNTFYRKLSFWTLLNAHTVIALTKYLVDNLKNVGFERDIKIIPWGIDTEVFRFQRKQLSTPVQFLHVANLHPVKDQNTLLHAFKIISDRISAQLTIIGEGVFKDNLQALISELNLKEKVVIVEPVQYKDLPPYYHRSDILLHTSISEGQSEVVTEAMSCGVLVCGTRVGLLYDLPECCVSVHVGAYKDLALEILKVIDDHQRILELKDCAHAWSKIHTIFWTVERTKELYSNA